MVDPNLAADGAVHLGQQAGRQHEQGQSAGVSRGNETGKVANHSPAQRDDNGVPVGPHRDQLVVKLDSRFQALGRLAGGQHDRMAFYADAVESGPTARQVVKTGDIPVGDDQRGTARVASPGRIQHRASKRSATGDVATGHPHLIGARPQRYEHPDVLAQ